jgi:hypothetical protein
MSIVHDNIIKSYLVDFEKETLIFKTQYEAQENTDVIFTGYLTHIFCCEIKNNIIFDIKEHPLNEFLKDEQELLEKQKNSAWPVSYDTTADLLNYLQVNKYKAFFVSSSLGLSGWVLAKQMDIITKQLQPPNP